MTMDFVDKLSVAGEVRFDCFLWTMVGAKASLLSSEHRRFAGCENDEGCVKSLTGLS